MTKTMDFASRLDFVATAQQQLGIESVLWDTANTLRGSVDSSDYKHVVLGLLFLKYLFDLQLHPDFRTKSLKVGKLTWRDVEAAADEVTPARALDRVVAEVETLNPGLRDAFPRFGTFEGLSSDALKKLVHALTPIDLAAARENGKDILSRTYEYFHSKFAAAEGRLGGEFYTPMSIVRLMVALLEPFQGRIYDPACGAGGLFIQAQASAAAHGWSTDNVKVFGQESNPMTWRLARLNLALHGLQFNLGAKWGDTFAQDMHEELRADYIMTNPPFGKGTTWPRDQLAMDPRWTYGLPPANPANFAWIQHYLARLNESGTAITVMPNGTLTSRSTEGEIRAALIEDDTVECIVSLPTQLFYSTPIPVCLWILAKNKNARASKRDRSGEVLLIDASKLGFMTSKAHRDLSAEDVEQIERIYKLWQQRELEEGEFPGVAVAVTRQDLARRGFSLNPSEYIVQEVAVDASRVLAEAGPTLDAAMESLRSVDAYGSELRSQFAGEGLQLSRRKKAPKGWETVAIRQVGTVVGGGTPDTKNSALFGGDIPWVTPRDMANHQGREICGGDRSLTRAGLDGSGAKLVPAGAILVSSRAPIGLVAMAGCDLSTNQGVRSVVLREDQDPRFWYYLLKASTDKLNAAGNGTTFRELRGTSLSAMEFTVPRRDEQSEIADWLEAGEMLASSAHALAGQLWELSQLVGPGLVTGLLSTGP